VACVRKRAASLRVGGTAGGVVLGGGVPLSGGGATPSPPPPHAVSATVEIVAAATNQRRKLNMAALKPRWRVFAVDISSSPCLGLLTRIVTLLAPAVDVD
jgi:hypothetical protein